MSEIYIPCALQALLVIFRALLCEHESFYIFPTYEHRPAINDSVCSVYYIVSLKSMKYYYTSIDLSLNRCFEFLVRVTAPLSLRLRRTRTVQGRYGDVERRCVVTNKRTERAAFRALSPLILSAICLPCLRKRRKNTQVKSLYKRQRHSHRAASLKSLWGFFPKMR